MIIYTDGSCLGNPGPGGWAAILTLEGQDYRKELFGGFRRTTNNRMEIFAACQALAALKRPCEVDLYTDSRYLRDALEKGWIFAWQKNGWRKADKKPALNVDLWRRLLTNMRGHKLNVIWLKGHAGHDENERCDELARMGAARSDSPPDTGYEEAAENL